MAVFRVNSDERENDQWFDIGEHDADIPIVLGESSLRLSDRSRDSFDQKRTNINASRVQEG